MPTQCRQCGKPTGGNKYCGTPCKAKWHNNNRTLTPNMIYDCEICGKHVEKWCSPKSIKAGINQGRFCSRTCAGKWRRGKNHPNWKNGSKRDKDGYVLLHRPAHPRADNTGYVRKHRLIVESHIGRFLTADEVVHHKNGITSDNRYRNLKLYPNNREHKKDDYKNRRIDKKGQFIPKAGRHTKRGG